MIYTATPAIDYPRIFPITDRTPSCYECGEHSNLYEHPKRGLLCVDCWPKCERRECNDMQEPDSPSDECLGHTIESLAQEIKDTPLSEPAFITQLMKEMEGWRVQP